MFNTKKEKLTALGAVALIIVATAVVDNGLERLMNSSKKCNKCEERLFDKVDSIANNVNTLVLDADTLKASADTLKRTTHQIKTMVEEDLDLDRNTNEVVNGCTRPRCGDTNVVPAKKPVKRDTRDTVVVVQRPRDTVPAVDTTKRNALFTTVVVGCCYSEQR